MKDFMDRFKKDLQQLQTALQKEGDVLLKKVKSQATRENLIKKTREFEHTVEQRLKNFEPALDQFIKKVRTSAERAGIDVASLEKKFQSATRSAKSRVSRGAAKPKAQAKSKAKGTTAKKKTTKR